MLDLVPAVAHHLLVLAIFAIAFSEFWDLRRGMSAEAGAHRLHRPGYRILAAAMARGCGEF